MPRFLYYGASSSYTPMTWFKGTTGEQVNDAATHTFTNQALGSDATGGLVVVLVTWGTSAGQSVTGFTIGGSTPTYTEQHQSLGGAAIGYITGITGTTATITFTTTGLCRRVVIKPYVLFPVSTTPVDTVSLTVGTGTSQTATDVEVKAGGVILCAHQAGTRATRTVAYNGVDTLTTDVDSGTAENTNNHIMISGATTENNTTRDITISAVSQNGQMSTVAMSWL
jgi:hypothetical protein